MHPVRGPAVFIALSLTALSALRAWAASPIVKPHEAALPLQQEPLPELAPGCKRVFTADITGSTERRAIRGKNGTCAAGIKDEEERQLTETDLDCLTRGYEGAREIRVNCTRAARRTAKGTQLQLHFDTTWRCFKTVCAPPK